MYEDIRKCKLLDIALAMINLEHLQDKENQLKFIKRAENHIILTHDALMKGKNLRAVLALFSVFNQIEMTTAELWRKLEALLEK